MPPAPLAAAPAAPLTTGPRRRGRRVWGRVALVGVILLFAAGIAQLFNLRFATGDVYAPYSSFRSDPLGTKALYYSLEDLPGLRVERNLRPLRYLGEEPSAVLKHRDDDPDPAKGFGPVAVFYLGVSAFDWPFLFPEAETQRLEALMNRGGRLILAFLPTNVEMTGTRLRTDRSREEKSLKKAGSDDEKKTKATPKPSPAASPTASASPSPASPKPASPNASPSVSPTPTPALTVTEKLTTKLDLIRRWQVDFRRKALPSSKDGKAKPGAQKAPAPLEEVARPLPGVPADLKPVTWHTSVDFDLDSTASKAGWQGLYARSGKPVIVSRPFGSAGGELILITDPYFFSNEALNKEPHPTLLAALIGPCRRLIFEETHLGVSEQPGMMTLARRYHLEGAFAALAVLAILFLWKNMVGLVPPPVNAFEDAVSSNYVTGRDSGEGFVNLLRRGVSPRDLLKTCLTQWRSANTLPGSRRPDPELSARLEEIVAAEAAQPVHRRSPAAAYRAICAALKRRSAPKTPAGGS